MVHCRPQSECMFVCVCVLWVGAGVMGGGPGGAAESKPAHREGLLS